MSVPVRSHPLSRCLQSHLTGIEIAHAWWRSVCSRSLQSHLTGIEIGRYGWSQTGLFKPSIAPHWNWNMLAAGFLPESSSPSIAPHWNWNPKNSRNLLPFPFSFNRTSLELKFSVWKRIGSSVISLQSHLTGIEISYADDFADAIKDLQSHLTGIEIFGNDVGNSKIAGLQSHLTGIEIPRASRILQRIVCLQSHLTGIEIWLD